MPAHLFRHHALWIPAVLVFLVSSGTGVRAQSRMYSPVSLPASREINDTLSPQDIPTGTGGFARDYTVSLEAGDQVAIDVISDQFDTLVTLINKDGAAVGENDDGPDGTTNSLLFARITQAGTYTVRVQAYGGGGGGKFYLKVARLREIP
ncbi:MAG: PPC domain-containing protein [Nodosilinea sp.]